RYSAQAERAAAIARVARRLFAVRRLKMRIADPLRVEAFDRFRRQRSAVDQARIALQLDVAHLAPSARFLEMKGDLQGDAAARQDGHRRPDLAEQRAGGDRGYHPRAAGQRLPLHATLPRPHVEGPPVADLDEVHV